MRTFLLSPALFLLATLGAAAEPAASDVPPPPQPPPQVAPPASDEVHFALEFRAARLGQVLDYLAKEAGYILTAPTVELAAPITLVAKQPVTPAEALEALNGILVEQGYAAIVRGRSLRVVPLPTAKQQNLPVQVGSDPELIAESDRMITQIIPIQFATAKDLAENLQPLLNPSTATLSSNESSNLLILTDTQSNVRRIVSIIHAIDTSVSGELEIKVFHLAHAAADKVATIIENIYGKGSSTNNRNNNQIDPMARMFGGQGRGGGNGGGGQDAKSATPGRSTDVSAAADTGTNSLVVRASPLALKSLSAVITQLDTDTTASDGVLVYRVRNAKAKDLATALSGLFQNATTGGTGSNNVNNRNGNQNRTVPGANGGGAGGGNGATSVSGAAGGTLDLSGQVVVVAETTSNSVLVLSAERNFERLRRILSELDQPMRQVLVRMLIAEVTLEDGLDAGIELTGTNPANANNPSHVSTNFNLSDNTVGLNGFLLNNAYFQATVHALSSTTRFDVLSRPYILTTDNQLATVKVVQEVPIVTGSRIDQNNNVSTTFERQEVGIILSVTPQINSDGRVVLQVDQQLSALTDQTIQIAPDVTSPIIKNRSMTTTVTMDKGQTVVVGGLVSDTYTQTVNKVPLLGDIPWMGALFRRTIRNQAKTELLVFLTPLVVQSSDDLNDMSTQIRNDMKSLNAAVENEALQGHLDRLMGVAVGERLTVKPVRTVPAKDPAPTEGAKP
jgi:general secretion pathway protein D